MYSAPSLPWMVSLRGRCLEVITCSCSSAGRRAAQVLRQGGTRELGCKASHVQVSLLLLCVHLAARQTTNTARFQKARRPQRTCGAKAAMVTSGSPAM